MIGNLQSLEHKTPVPPIPANLLDGASAVANLEWSTTLSPKISLDKVLYVPNFSCNLIYAAQLIRELKGLMIFYEDLCVIQDRTPLIGVGRL